MYYLMNGNKYTYAKNENGLFANTSNMDTNNYKWTFTFVYNGVIKLTNAGQSRQISINLDTNSFRAYKDTSSAAGYVKL